MALPRNTTVFRRDAPRYVAALMADFGLSDVQAAAFPGNFGLESAGFTQMQELRPAIRGSKGGLGPAQWTGPRRRAYEAWLKRKRAKPGTFEVDYGFLFRELKGTESGVLAPLRKAKTVEQAVEIVMDRYERPGVEHLARRIEWGRLALEAYRARRITEKPEVGTATPKLEPTTWWERLLGLGTPVSASVGKNRGDEVLFRAQNRLLAAGYTEVGDPDGLWGDGTRTAVALALRDQFPRIAPPEDWPLSDEVLAALAKLARRKVSAERAEVTVKELRERGATPIKAPVNLTIGGGLLSFLGLGKAIQETGIPEKITAVSDQAGEIMASLQAIIGALGTAFAFAYRHWWLLVLALGLYWIAKGVRWALEIRALVRQGSIRQTRL